MSNVQIIANILADAESRKDRKLGKQLQKQNPGMDRIRVYAIKLYDLFLRLIDEESRSRIASLDKTINTISEANMTDGGWHITEDGIFHENSKYMRVKDANGNDLIVSSFELPRTEAGYVLHDYVVDNVDLELIRGTEARFLREHAEELAKIHEAFIARDQILKNGEYALVDEKNRALLTAIENLFGYNKVKEQEMQK